MKRVSCAPLVPEALPEIVQLDQRCFGGLWSLAGYERELASPNSDLLVLERDKGITASAGLSDQAGTGLEAALLGVGCCWAILDEAHITLLGISPQIQGQGLGQWLLLQLLLAGRDRNLQRATLEVRASNGPALSLYKKFGFQVAGRRQRYYDNGEDALILWLGGLCDPHLEPTWKLWHQQSQDRLLTSGWRPTMTHNEAPKQKAVSWQ
jgi:ribosomal-protein-alanine N-acetyltransferase